MTEDIENSDSNEIDSVPENTLAPRRRGRPKGSKNQSNKSEPKGETFRTDTQPRKPYIRRNQTNAKKVYETVGTAIVILDKGISFVSPTWASMSLQAEEIGQLSIALGDEFLTSKKLSEFIMKAAEQSVHIRLAHVCLAIAIPRLLATGHFGDLANALGSTTPIPVETGSTSGSDGGHGNGQIDNAFAAHPASPVLDNSAK